MTRLTPVSIRLGGRLSETIRGSIWQLTHSLALLTLKLMALHEVYSQAVFKTQTSFECGPQLPFRSVCAAK